MQIISGFLLQFFSHLDSIKLYFQVSVILNSYTLFKIVKGYVTFQYVLISLNKILFQSCLLVYVQRSTIKNSRALLPLQIRKFKTIFIVRYSERTA